MTLAEVTATVTHRADVVEARLRRLGGRYGRPLRDALVIIGIGRALFYYGVQGIHPWEYLGVDARAYWSVDLAHPYAQSGVGVLSTYLYSPAFAQILAPFSLLPFPVFYALWTVMLVGILIWLVRPWPWALGILALPITYELAVGQVHLLIAAAIVVGFARPAAWALPILTKLTPSIGLLWFAIRQEWRGLAEAVGVTGADRGRLVHPQPERVVRLVHVPHLEHRSRRGAVPARRGRHRDHGAGGAERPALARAGGDLDRPAGRLDRIVGHPAGHHPARPGPRHGRIDGPTRGRRTPRRTPRLAGRRDLTEESHPGSGWPVRTADFRPDRLGQSYRSAVAKAGATLHRPCVSPYCCTGSPSPFGWC